MSICLTLLGREVELMFRPTGDYNGHAILTLGPITIYRWRSA